MTVMMRTPTHAFTDGSIYGSRYQGTFYLNASREYNAAADALAAMRGTGEGSPQVRHESSQPPAKIPTKAPTKAGGDDDKGTKEEKQDLGHSCERSGRWRVCSELAVFFKSTSLSDERAS